MNRFWQRTDDLERELVTARPQAPKELVDAVVGGLQPSRRVSRRSRLGLGVAVAGVALIGFGVGGGYASSSASKSASKESSAIKLDQSARVHRAGSSAAAQYCPPDCFVRVPPYPPPRPTTPVPPTPPSTSPGTTPTQPGSSPSSGGPFKPPATHTPGSTGTGGTSGQNGSGGVPPVKSSSGLPFTGLSLWIPVVAGLGLVLLGFALRRSARRTT